MLPELANTGGHNDSLLPSAARAFHGNLGSLVVAIQKSQSPPLLKTENPDRLTIFPIRGICETPCESERGK